MKKTLLLFYFLSVSFFLCAQECMLVELPLNQKIKDCTYVIEGEVISTEGFWNKEHNRIYTSNIIRIYKIFKGKNEGSEVEIITRGGRVENTIHEITPNVKLQPGDAGIFFCNDNRLKNLPDGKNKLQRLEGYGSSQGFINYNLKDLSAQAPFQQFNSIKEVYEKIQRIINTEYQTVTPVEWKKKMNVLRSPPVITGFSPAFITAGTKSILTINGNNFGSSQGSGKVYFKNANSGGADYINPPASNQYISWSDTKIEVMVPSRAGTGTIQVENNNGEISTGSTSLNIIYAQLNVVSGNNAYQPDHNDNNGSGGYTWQMNNVFASNAPASASFQRALQTWTCNTFINWKVGSNTNVSVAAQDGINVAKFGSSSQMPAGVLAWCLSYYQSCSSGGNVEFFVKEIDIEFNDGFNWEYGPALPVGGKYDFETVAVHELGHGHQLGHVINNSIVMHYALGSGMSKRSLNAASDIAGGNYVMTQSVTSNLCSGNTMTPLTATNCAVTAPLADFTADFTQICPGETINFTDKTIGNPITWNWTFPGGSPSTSNSQNPTVTYNSSGIYDVSLTVSNANGSNSLTKTSYITVALPTAIISGTTTINTGGSTFLKIIFTGKSPYNFTYSDGTNMNTVSGINSNPYYLLVSPSATIIYTLTAMNDADCSGTVSGNATVTVKTGSSTSNDTGLVACYPFTGNANDAVGNNNGTVTGAKLTPDRFASVNNAYSFDGFSGDHIDLGTGTNIQSSEMTISVWVSIDTNSCYTSGLNYQPIIIARNTNYPAGWYEAYGIGYWLPNNNFLCLTFQSGTTNGPVIWSADNSVTFHEWYHLVLTFNDDSMWFYIDGLLIDKKSKGFKTTYALNSPVNIGYTGNSVKEGYLNGNIDNVKIFNRVLSPSEINSLTDECPLYTNNNGLIGCYPLDDNANDYSGNNYNGTPTNVTPTTDHVGNINKAYHFSGSGSYVSIPDSVFQLNEFTYSLWCKPTSLPSSGTDYALLTIGGNVADQHVVIGNANGRIGFGFSSYDNLGNPYNSCFQGFLPTINQWYHIVVIRNFDSLAMYINNTLICSQNMGNIPGYLGNPISATIGSRLTCCFQNFVGDIDAVKIFNRGLSASEINSLTDECPASVCSGSQNTFQKTYGNLSDEISDALTNVLLSDGSIVFVGVTNNSGNNDIALTKITSSGNILWTKTYGGSGDDVGTSVVLTTDNGFIITGYTNSFGQGSYDFYNIKTDANGTVQWSKTYGASGDEKANNTILTADGGYLIGGHTFSFGAGKREIFLVKTDASGTIQWSKGIGGSDSENGMPVLQTPDNGYIIRAYSFTFGQGGSCDDFIFKLDVSGNILWAKTYGVSSANESSSSLIQTSDDGFIVAGFYNEFGDWDITFKKLDSLGNFISGKIYRGGNDDMAYSIYETSDKEFLMIGYTNSFGFGNDDIFMLKIDNSGNMQWSNVYGGSGIDRTRSMLKTIDGGFQIIGYSNSFSGGDNDFYVVKTDCNGNSGCNQQSFIPTVINYSPIVTNQNPTLTIGGVEAIANTIENTITYIDNSVCNIDTCNIIVGFTLSDTLLCKSNTIFFTNTSVNATSYEWKIDGVSQSTNTNFSYLFNIPGTHQVTLIASNSVCADSVTRIITLLNVISAFMVNDTLICDSASLFFTNTSIGATNYEWRINNFFYSNAKDTVIRFVSSGSYTVKLIASNLICSDTFQRIITVIDKFIAVAWNDTTICQGDSVQLFASSGTSHFWFPSTGLNDSAIATPFAKILATIKYGVIVTGYGCPPDTAYVTVTVDSPAIAIAFPDTIICEQDSVQLNAGTGDNYQWFPITGLSNIVISNPVATPDSTTIYGVVVSKTIMSVGQIQLM